MGDMLSQAEIDALLGGAPEPEEEDENVTEGAAELAAAPVETPAAGFDAPPSVSADTPADLSGSLTHDQKDILGEIGNISMGTAATTLFALLGKKVWITTPVVNVNTWGEVQKSYARPCVGTRIDYKEGLKGSNVLILNQHDVKIITNLMMGGDGTVSTDEPLNDIDLSAMGEAMNQMIGSSSTSLSSLVKMKIDIDTPNSFKMDFAENDYFETIDFKQDETIVSISFRMEVDGLIDSQIMQVLPIQFAIDMVEKMKVDMFGGQPAQTSAPPPPPPQQQTAAPPPPPQQQQQTAAPPPPPQQQTAAPPPQMQPPPQQTYYQGPQTQPMQNINVSPVQFQNFDMQSVIQQKENMNIIMEVPLEISVELGRTHMKIKDILEFTPGTIVELEKLAGEPIDVLVNGKFVAKGEVVVVMDENFGVRITDIVSVENRI